MRFESKPDLPITFTNAVNVNVAGSMVYFDFGVIDSFRVGDLLQSGKKELTVTIPVIFRAAMPIDDMRQLHARLTLQMQRLGIPPLEPSEIEDPHAEK